MYNKKYTERENNNFIWQTRCHGVKSICKKTNNKNEKVNASSIIHWFHYISFKILF